MASQKNIEVLKKLKVEIKAARALFLADYRGLTHQQLEELRKGLKKINAKFLIAKNTLIKIALKDNKIPDSEKLETELNNPTATFLINGDEISAIKVLSDYIKKTQLPKIKIGLFEGKIATEADFNKLSSLPTKDILIATICSRMKSPVYGLHYALNWNLVRFATVLGNIKGKKPSN